MNFKIYLISLLILVIAIFLGTFGIFGLIGSLQRLFSYGFSFGAIIDEGFLILIWAFHLFLARFLYKKGRKIREKA